MHNPKAVGERSEAFLIAHFLLRGETVLRPFGDNQRYDLVLDRGGVFARVQCKTGILKNGAVGFWTCSNAGGKGKRGYAGEVEFFAVYCPQNGKAYLVPIEDAPTRSMQLRIEPPKNNSSVTTVRWAKNYEF